MYLVLALIYTGGATYHCRCSDSAWRASLEHCESVPSSQQSSAAAIQLWTTTPYSGTAVSFPDFQTRPACPAICNAVCGAIPRSAAATDGYGQRYI